MMKNRRTLVAVIWLVSFLAGVLAGESALGFHQWNGYQWGKLKLIVANQAKRNKKSWNYKRIYNQEVFRRKGKQPHDSWKDKHTPLKIKKFRTKRHKESDIDIRLFADDYGFTGWLGSATIYFTPSNIIVYAEARLNNTYLKNKSFYSKKNVAHVACQEFGHDLGLDHNRGANDTCMNDFILNQDHHNKHDDEQLNLMYD